MRKTLLFTSSIRCTLTYNQPIQPILLDNPSIRCLLGGSGGTSDNLDQLSGNDGLASAVEKNLELSDHFSGVLGSVVHGVTASGNLASVALRKTLRRIRKSSSSREFGALYPVDRVGKSELAEVGELLIVDLEGGVVGLNGGQHISAKIEYYSKSNWARFISEGRQRKFSTRFCALGKYSDLHPRMFHHEKNP